MKTTKIKIAALSSLPMAAMLLTAATGLTTVAGLATLEPARAGVMPLVNNNNAVTVVCGYNAHTNNCSSTGDTCQIQSRFGNTNGTCQPNFANCFCQA